MLQKNTKAFVIWGALAGALGAFVIVMSSVGPMPYRQLYIIQRLPLALVVCAFIGGLAGAALSFFGIGAKTVELSCGVGTAVVATVLSLFVLKFDWDASVVVEQQFSVFKEMSLVLVLFMFPAGMVAVGSYAHVSRRRAWGQLVLAIGSVAVLGAFFLVFMVLPMGFTRMSAWSVLNLGYVLLAVLALIFSLKARKELT